MYGLATLHGVRGRQTTSWWQ